jgi:hypothetical protein
MNQNNPHDGILLRESRKSYSRRLFIRNNSLLTAGFIIKPSLFFTADKLQYDHFLLGCSSLDAGIQFIKDKTGIEALKGGKHPHIGTHNALLSLGEKVYLEIIAPDPEAKSLINEYAFLKEMSAPALIMWAARTDNMDDLLKRVQQAGYKNSGISPGSRQRADGTVLKWRSLSVETGINSVVPFFIEWDKSSRHPSIDSPKGCSVDNFEIEYPEPEKLKAVFTQLQIDVPLKKGIKASLQLKINSPKGTILL